MNEYLGNEMQLFSVKEARLVGGKQDNMRVLIVKNASGLEFTVSLDRCADIAELSVKGDNFAFIGPCGYVAPTYYDNKGANFLKSFTAGFLTTCGLNNVGGNVNVDGVEYGLHGSIANTPCEKYCYFVENNEIHVKAVIRDASLFNDKLLLEREYVCPINENVIYLKDTVKNIGFNDTPVMILYHCNMGYPLLSEDAKLNIPTNKVVARDAHAQTGIDNWNVIEKPQKDYQEMCFFHEMNEETPTVSLYNEKINKGVEITYNTKELPCFTQWKMMGQGEYVLGLEPGTCNPDGRIEILKKGTYDNLGAGQSKNYNLKFKFI